MGKQSYWWRLVDLVTYTVLLIVCFSCPTPDAAIQSSLCVCVCVCVDMCVSVDVCVCGCVCVCVFQESCVLLAMHITIFARILLQNQEVLWSIVQHLAQSTGRDVSGLLTHILSALPFLHLTHALTHTHLHAHSCTHTRTHARTHACTHTHTHTHAHTHTFACRFFF